MEDVLVMVVIAVVILVLVPIPAIVTALKGKYIMVVLGALFYPCWWFAAIRLAEPESYWARHFYDQQKMTKARARSPEVPPRLLP